MQDKLLYGFKVAKENSCLLASMIEDNVDNGWVMDE